jgi:hypothetical protein
MPNPQVVPPLVQRALLEQQDLKARLGQPVLQGPTVQQEQMGFKATRAHRVHEVNRDLKVTQELQVLKDPLD